MFSSTLIVLCICVLPSLHASNWQPSLGTTSSVAVSPFLNVPPPRTVP